MLFQTAQLVVLFVSLPSLVICDCPNNLPARKKDVDLKKLEGMWYEYGANTRKFSYLLMDAGCVPVYFHEVTKPPSYYIYYKNITDTENPLKTLASLYKSDGEYKVTYMRAKHYLKGSFLILNTDYKCWAVIYTCTKSEPAYVSILQKSIDGKKCFNEQTGKEVEPVLQRVGLKLSQMDLNNAGNDCEYTPEPWELI